MKIYELVKILRQLSEDGSEAQVYIVEEGQPGQWPVEVVRPAKSGEIRPVETNNTMRTAVVAPSDGNQKNAAFTLHTLIERLAHGWPDEGDVCAEFTPADGGEIRLGNVRRAEWKMLIEIGNQPTRVVAIVVGD